MRQLLRRYVYINRPMKIRVSFLRDVNFELRGEISSENIIKVDIDRCIEKLKTG